MPEFQLGDFANALVQIILAGIYTYLVVRSYHAPDLMRDHTKLQMTPLARGAAFISGVTAVVIGAGLLGFWINNLASGGAPMADQNGPSIFNFILNIISSVMVLIAGISVIGRWKWSFALYGLAALVLLTSTLFAMIPDSNGNIAPREITIEASAATILIIMGGIAVTTQYFHLLRIKERRTPKPLHH